MTGQMPPGKVKLTDAEMDVIRGWVDKLPPVAAVEAVSEHEVRGILQARCVACHGAGEKKGGLDLQNDGEPAKGREVRAGAGAGQAGGEPAV